MLKALKAQVVAVAAAVAVEALAVARRLPHLEFAAAEVLAERVRAREQPAAMLKAAVRMMASVLMPSTLSSCLVWDLTLPATLVAVAGMMASVMMPSTLSSGLARNLGSPAARM